MGPAWLDFGRAGLGARRTIIRYCKIARKWRSQKQDSTCAHEVEIRQLRFLPLLWLQGSVRAALKITVALQSA